MIGRRSLLMGLALAPLDAMAGVTRKAAASAPVALDPDKTVTLHYAEAISYEIVLGANSTVVGIRVPDNFIKVVFPPEVQGKIEDRLAEAHASYPPDSVLAGRPR
jgi:hypothetical protein